MPTPRRPLALLSQWCHYCTLTGLTATTTREHQRETQTETRTETQI